MKDDVGTREVLLALRTCTGLMKIVIEFNGSGDSGQIDDVRLLGVLSKGREQEIADMPLPTELAALFEESEPSTSKTVQAFIETWAYNLIEQVVDFDWYNNDGGGGTITIEPYTGRVEIDAYQRVTTEEPHSFDASIENDPDFRALNPEEVERLCG